MIVVFFIICIIFGSNAVPKDIIAFFPTAKGNLTKITWAHAVNSQKLLKSALSSNVMMLEADVLLGKVANATSEKIVPIMGHPPSTVSDLSLVEFLQKVQVFNTLAKENYVKKGIKLDFKSIEAFEGALTVLKEYYLQMDFPLWLNADILPGPLDSTTKPVDPNRFLPPCKKFRNVTISIGWTTQYVKNVQVKYTLTQVEEMFDVIKKHAIEQPITIPIRAGFATESFLELKELLYVLPPGSTLTLWHGKGDHVDAERLSMIINSLGVARVFIDLPPEILDILNLDA